MTSGLVHLGYSLPEGQAGKFNFFVLEHLTELVADVIGVNSDNIQEELD